MKKVAITGKRQAELVEIPDPEPKGDFVVVKVMAAPMCTEYKSFEAGRGYSRLGHEAAGEVAAVAQPGRVKVGDRVLVLPQYGCGTCEYCLAGEYVYCQDGWDLNEVFGTDEYGGTYAQYLVKPDWLLAPIPEGMDYVHASLANCALGPTFGAMQLADVTAFDTVMITGLGPVGLGGIVNALYRGARVIAIESIPYRVEVAKKMGVEHVINPKDDDALEQVLALTEKGRGVDVAVDCSGVAAAERFCIDAAKRRGRVVFVGENYDKSIEIMVSPDMIRKGLKLFGSWNYNLNDVPKIFQIIQNSPVVENLISHVMPMSKIQEAFELSASHQTAKVILKPWE